MVAKTPGFYGRAVVGLCLTAFVLAACERADRQICAPMPAADKSDLAAYQVADRDPRVIAARKASPSTSGISFAGAAEKGRAQREVLEGCITRASYRLAKSGASNDDIGKAVVTACSEVLRAAVADADPVDLLGQTPEQVRDVSLAQISLRTLEAKTGHCWAQGQ